MHQTYSNNLLTITNDFYSNFRQQSKKIRRLQLFTFFIMISFQVFCNLLKPNNHSSAQKIKISKLIQQTYFNTFILFQLHYKTRNVFKPKVCYKINRTFQTNFQLLLPPTLNTTCNNSPQQNNLHLPTVSHPFIYSLSRSSLLLYLQLQIRLIFSLCCPSLKLIRKNSSFEIIKILPNLSPNFTLPTQQFIHTAFKKIRDY
eukprot:TRINITY_DN22187_c0_g1_i1.p3 TRINITY_DN22187_c0_g1~~TRINITY_DN22187_c0_g1_i1.p3  ORF type:complete len:201 (-),score=-24.00 TRINITY_DN22187_c0_g1_i1:298-900(-)